MDRLFAEIQRLRAAGDINLPIRFMRMHPQTFARIVTEPGEIGNYHIQVTGAGKTKIHNATVDEDPAMPFGLVEFTGPYFDAQTARVYAE